MLRSLYPFRKTHPSSMGFNAGDLFVELSGASRDRNWFYVLNSSGSVGYVPKNYVQNVEDKNRNKFLEEVERKILTEEVIPNRECTLEKIRQLRGTDTSKKKRPAPQPPEEARVARELVDLVRIESGLTYDASRDLSIAILRYLSDNSHDVKPTLLALESLYISTEPIPNYTSPDAKVMQELLNRLTECKEDDQQRNWMLHEDEYTISKLLEDLYDHLGKSDRSVSMSVLSRYKYFYVQSLIDYFQMETRWTLRKCLMEIFLTMCSLDPVIISLALNSVLTLELAQDMYQNLDDVERLCHASLVLTALFSRGEAMPVQYFDQLGSDFITFLLEQIEYPRSIEHEREIADTFVGLLLSYNLQFEKIESNVLMNVLSKQRGAKVYTEKILLLLNREEDPSAIISDNKPKVHATRKVIIDMFSHSSCHRLFYTNDIYVLIDIVVRQLTDLSAEDPRRSTYLEMCNLVLRHTDYSEHLHRFKDLEKCFIRILDEEEDEDTSSKTDKAVVHKIIKEVDAFNSLDS